MKTYFGIFETKGTAPVESTVLVFDETLSIGYRSIEGLNQMIQWRLKDLKPSVDFSRQATVITHSQQPGSLLIEGREAAAYILALQSENALPWYRKKNAREWARNSMLFAGVAGLLVILYLIFVPWIAEKLADKVPVNREKQMGDAVYDAMGLEEIEDRESSAILNEFFKAMAVPTAYDIRISVVEDNVVNAFALPGGRIVVYKALLRQVRSYPELAALLSHEFTHIDQKHSTKRIFRSLGSKVFLGLLFGRFGSVTAVMVNQADELKNLKYSRSLEKEADLKGLEILLQRKIDPGGFADLFMHLKDHSPGSSVPEFLGSHPDIEKRMNYIREQSSTTPIEEDEGLKAIFEKLK